MTIFWVFFRSVFELVEKNSNKNKIHFTFSFTLPNLLLKTQLKNSTKQGRNSSSNSSIFLAYRFLVNTQWSRRVAFSKWLTKKGWWWSRWCVSDELVLTSFLRILLYKLPDVYAARRGEIWTDRNRVFVHRVWGFNANQI